LPLPRRWGTILAEVMTRALLLPPLLLTLTLLLLAACGDGGGDEPARGSLTDPASVPTATPWSDPPDPIILDPDALTPISGGEGDDGADGEGDGTPTASGECGDTYVVETGDVPFTIAEKCGVDVADLLEANGIDDPTGLRVGQELVIP
jgi:hypothetical protein